MKTRKFLSGAWYHIYTLSRDGGVLFYRLTDRLCLFTVLSVYARKYNMVVLGVSIMFTHLHMMIRALDLTHLRSFVGQSLATFSRIVNADRGQRGELFRRPFGSAPRLEEKEMRSSLVYLYNNPVEKHLCKKAVEDRWTFLAYYNNTHPFSERLVKRNVSFRLRQAADFIDAEQAAGRYLRPATLRRLFSGLDKHEQEQLTDHIITRYQFICYEEAIAIFGSYDKMLLATEASTGKEFEVGEVYDRSSDVPYREMTIAAAKAHLFDGWRILHLQEEEKRHWIHHFQIHTHAKEAQIRKFLHL